MTVIMKSRLATSVFHVRSNLTPVECLFFCLCSSIVLTSLPFLFFPDDASSHVHGMLTQDNLFDGTIVTNLEQYYIEPAARYGSELERQGIHTVIYKLSDVKIRQDHHSHGPKKARSSSSSISSAVKGGEATTSSAQNQFNQKSDDSGSSESGDSGIRRSSSSDSSSDRLSRQSEGARGGRGDEGEESEAELVRRKRSNRKSDIKRRKRWLPEEVSCYLYVAIVGISIFNI